MKYLFVENCQNVIVLLNHNSSKLLFCFSLWVVQNMHYSDFALEQNGFDGVYL